jgi:transglutaminase-like putative cysteine protease
MNYRLTLTAAFACLATSTALAPLIQGPTWFWSGLGAIVLVAAAGAATRQRALRALPAGVCLLIALVVLVLYLNVVFAARFSFIRIIPTGHSLTQLWRLARQGLHDTQAYAQPVPAFPGIIFLAAGGTGLVAAITDLVAVRLRRSALAGLPLLVLFSVPIASGAGHNALLTGVLFCIGMAGYLSLLGADGRERLRLWGRLVTPWHTGPGETDDNEAGPRTGALAASGRRIGTAAIVLAIFTPLLIPGLTPHKLFPGHGIGSGTGAGYGNGPGGSLAPIAQMTNDLHEAKPTEVFSYHTTAGFPPPYLQVYALTQIGTTSWDPPNGLVEHNTPVAKGQTLPTVPGLTDQDWGKITTTVTVKSGTPLNTYLPVPYPARLVDPPGGGWVVDPGTLMVYTDTGTTMTTGRYSVTSLDVEPSYAQFEAVPKANPKEMGSYLTVPPSFDSLSGLARKIVKNALTPYDEAVALQNWFATSGLFHYSLTVSTPDTTANALSYFLNHGRRGYCQQFAFAMAALARLLGIPSRVAVGYTEGSPRGGGTYVVKTSDAHAWPELYFSGLGWLSWEPTPAGGAVGQATAVAPSYTSGSGAASATGPGAPPNLSGAKGPTTATGRSSQLGHLRPPASDTLSGKNRSGATGPLGPTAPVHHGNSAPLAILVIAALALAGLVAPRITRSVVARRRWISAGSDGARAHAAWSEFLDTLTDYGLRHSPGETPRALARRMAAQLRMPESARQAVARLADLEERASYARGAGPSGGVSDDLATVRSAVAATVSKAGRWRAVLLPASAVTRLRRGLGHALDVFGWLEVAIARTVGRLPRPKPGRAEG